MAAPLSRRIVELENKLREAEETIKRLKRTKAEETTKVEDVEKVCEPFSVIINDVMWESKTFALLL